MELSLFASVGLGDRIQSLAERVAGRSRQQVWQRIEHRVATLDVVQARGYIHARASGVVREQFELLLAQDGNRIAKHRERITGSATEMLIQSILTSTQSARRTRVQRLAA